jgi:NAD(P)-dependent dehydrogenase (short-subunit alcohol dehydrogenase family)
MSKVIIITGASSGIGFALAEYFGKKGNKVYGLSRKVVSSDYFVSIPTILPRKTKSITPFLKS